MKLPNADRVQVDPEKLKRYLLSETHPIGRSKAKFFRGIGFDESNITVLQEALVEIAKSERILETASSVHGVKYIVDGLVLAPIGNRVKVRTLWIIDKGQEHPRFVTAYPG